MQTEMTISDITRTIDDSLSPEALEYWTNTTERNDFVVLAQREGVQKAIDELEAMVTE